MKSLGLMFKGKGPTNALAVALKGVHPYVHDIGNRAAFSFAELICPELREPTHLMRIAYTRSSMGRCRG